MCINDVGCGWVVLDSAVGQ